MSVCVACYESPVGRCPCADGKGTCPHPIMHPDFARQSFREGRVTSTALQWIAGEYRRLKGSSDGTDAPTP